MIKTIRKSRGERKLASPSKNFSPIPWAFSRQRLGTTLLLNQTQVLSCLYRHESDQHKAGQKQQEDHACPQCQGLNGLSEVSLHVHVCELPQVKNHKPEDHHRIKYPFHHDGSQ